MSTPQTENQETQNQTIVLEKTAFLPEGEKQNEQEAVSAAATSDKPTGLFINIQPPLEKLFRLRNPLIRELLAEYLGTFILCFFGISSLAQYTFNKPSPNSASFLAVNLGFGIGVTAAVLVVGKVSGCHINPAVSLAMFLTGRISLVKLGLYVVAQVLGALKAAAVVYFVYYDAFHDALKTFRGGVYGLETAGIFATYPGDHLSILGGLFDQIMGTWILVVVVLAVTDKRNVELPHASVAVVLGLTVTVIGASLAYNCGYAINPARDFGPRLFTFIWGWGSQVFTAGHYFFWIPIVAPLIGSVLGTLSYLLLISNHL